MNLITQELQPTTEYRTIPLTQGQVAIVDATDYEWLMQWKWCAGFDKTTKTFYAIGHVRDPKRRTIRMARVIMGEPAGLQVDHKNHDTLDNRRANLRIATPSQNSSNRKLRSDNTSGFKGIRRNHKGWQAAIGINRGWKALGTYPTKELAYAAYCEAASELHGEFKHL